jgi:hypothetical protein
MTLNFELTRQDIADYIKAVFFQKIKWWHLTIVGAVVIFYAGEKVHDSMKGGDFTSVWITISPILALVYIFSFMVWRVPSNAYKKMIIRPMEWRFSQERVHLQSPVASSEIEWNAFINYRETDRLFLLYVQSNVAHIIPKRALLEWQIEELRNLLSSHIKKA